MCSIIGVGDRLHKVLGQIDLGTLDSGERSLPFGLLVMFNFLLREMPAFSKRRNTILFTMTRKRNISGAPFHQLYFCKSQAIARFPSIEGPSLDQMIIPDMIK